MPEPLRIAVVTDIHHGRDHGTRRGSAALGLLSAFRDRVNLLHPDLVVDLGDRIGDVGTEDDRRLTREVASMFDDVVPPCVHLAGDRDLAGLSLAEAESAIGRRLTSHSRDVRGWHLVFWNAAVDTATDEGFELLPTDLEWLAEDLEETSLPSVVFSHLPLDDASLVGNIYRERDPRWPAYYREAPAVRRVIEGSGKVAFCVAGHTHRNALTTIDGIHYVTLQSLTETFTTAPEPAAASALISLGERIVVDVEGNEPLRLELPVRRRSHHWLRAASAASA